MNHDLVQHLISKMDSSEILHYASDYYDPAKAHEYYMKNRQLSGRTTSGLSEEGKEVWTDTKSNIASEKKNRIKEYQDQKEIDIKNSRDKAEQTRNSITEKLKKLSEQLAEKFKDKNTTISNQIKAINKNSGLSDEQKEAKKEKLYNKKEKLSSDKKEESTKNSTDAKAERTKVATDLKGAIQNARDMYSKNKESLDSQYEKVYQNEYDKIKSQYQSTKKSK